MPNARVFVDEAADLETPQKESWQDAAECTTVDPDIFFPTTKGKGAYSRSRKICGGCDVRLKCLAYILRMEGTISHNDRHGMFAGLTPKEREELSRRPSQESQTL